MSVLVDKSTRLIVQGDHRQRSTFHTKQMVEYGTNVVAGVTPGKGGTTHERHSRFQYGRRCRERSGREMLPVIYVPPGICRGRNHGSG